MRTEGFALWWKLDAPPSVVEPVIGWEEITVMGSKSYYPITPVKQDTKVGTFVLTFSSKNVVDVAWTLIDGVFVHYEDFDTAVQGAV